MELKVGVISKADFPRGRLSKQGSEVNGDERRKRFWLVKRRTAERRAKKRNEVLKTLQLDLYDRD